MQGADVPGTLISMISGKPVRRRRGPTQSWQGSSRASVHQTHQRRGKGHAHSNKRHGFCPRLTDGPVFQSHPRRLHTRPREHNAASATLAFQQEEGTVVRATAGFAGRLYFSLEERKQERKAFTTTKKKGQAPSVVDIAEDMYDKLVKLVLHMKRDASHSCLDRKQSCAT